MTQIVCTILRPDATRAVAIAGELAERMSLPLALVDIRPVVPGVAPVAVPQAPYVAGDAAVPPAAPVTDLEALARDAGVDPDLCEHVEAPAVAAIESLSRNPEVELLVAADSGGGPLATALKGDPPRAALRDLGAPLVLVPEQFGRSTVLADRPKIACAVLDDDSGAAATALAAELAERLGGTLAFVHAGEDEEAVGRLESTIAEAVPGNDDVVFEVLPEMASHDLHMWAEAQGADLLVTGPPRHGSFGSALLGSAVHTAAEHGSVPLVIAPEDYGSTSPRRMA
jgi:nucleotide-binding universal stress UspA family protein